MDNSSAKTATKSEVLQRLGIQPYILQVWEKKAAVSPLLHKGDAHYTEADLEKLSALKELLYEKGYTLDAAVRLLNENKPLHNSPNASLLASFKPTISANTPAPSKELTQKLLLLRTKLLTLRDLL